jgi:hypothetical protein
MLCSQDVEKKTIRQMADNNARPPSPRRSLQGDCRAGLARWADMGFEWLPDGFQCAPFTLHMLVAYRLEAEAEVVSASFAQFSADSQPVSCREEGMFVSFTVLVVLTQPGSSRRAGYTCRQNPSTFRLSAMAGMFCS